VPFSGHLLPLTLPHFPPLKPLFRSRPVNCGSPPGQMPDRNSETAFSPSRSPPNNEGIPSGFRRPHGHWTIWRIHIRVFSQCIYLVPKSDPYSTLAPIFCTRYSTILFGRTFTLGIDSKIHPRLSAGFQFSSFLPPPLLFRSLIQFSPAQIRGFWNQCPLSEFVHSRRFGSAECRQCGFFFVLYS